MCFAIFIGTGYFYLNKKIKTVNQNLDNVPYSQENNENKGILFSLLGKETFVYLDFFESKVVISINPEKSFEGQIYGYSHDYTVTAGDELIISIIDNVGGVELVSEGESLRYTGLQVAELLKRTSSTDFKKSLISEICKKIAKYGVDSNFFTDILNNSETNLNLAECYFWSESLYKLCANPHFID